MCSGLCRSVYTTRAANTIIQLLASFDMGKLAQQRLEAALKLLQTSLLAVTCALVGMLMVVGGVKALREYKLQALQEPLPHGEGFVMHTPCIVAYSRLLPAAEPPHVNHRARTLPQDHKSTEMV